MALMICGHPRSGTTLLRNLCHLHPSAAVTNEFGAFHFPGSSPRAYRRYVLRRWAGKGLLGHRTLVSTGAQTRRSLSLSLLRRHLFTARYVAGLWTARRRKPDVALVDKLYRAYFPEVLVCGDKMPDYVFDLDEYVGLEGLSIVVLYRDCRDVTRSTLEMARREWANRDRANFEKMSTAQKVAERWVRSIEIMERHRSSLHVVRYEDLVQKPRETLGALGDFLGVDAERFRFDLVRESSMGRHRQGLSEDELAAVLATAGPTMRRLGYLDAAA